MKTGDAFIMPIDVQLYERIDMSDKLLRVYQGDLVLCLSSFKGRVGILYNVLTPRGQAVISRSFVESLSREFLQPRTRRHAAR